MRLWFAQPSPSPGSASLRLARLGLASLGLASLGQAVQTSLTRLFDTAVTALSERLPGRFLNLPLVPRNLSSGCQGKFQGKAGCSGSQAFRPLYQKAGPRQEPPKNPLRIPWGMTNRVATKVGHRGLEFSLGFQALAVGFNSKNSSWGDSRQETS